MNISEVMDMPLTAACGRLWKRWFGKEVPYEPGSSDLPFLETGQIWQCRDQHYWVKLIDYTDSYWIGQVYCMRRADDGTQYAVEFTQWRYRTLRFRNNAYCVMNDDINDHDLVNLLRKS